MANESPEYLMFVRCLPCRMQMHDPCFGGVEAHHAGRDRGMGQRAHDSTAVPLCRKHHQCYHSLSGPFKTFKKQERRDWCAKQIDYVRQRWLDEDESQIW